MAKLCRRTQQAIPHLQRPATTGMATPPFAALATDAAQHRLATKATGHRQIRPLAIGDRVRFHSIDEAAYRALGGLL